jgi:hypothetical protein
LSPQVSSGEELSKTYFQNLARQIEVEVNEILETPELSPREKESLNAALLHKAIAVCAYQLYASRGYIDGFHLQDWLQAEQEILRQLDHQAEKARAAVG